MHFTAVLKVLRFYLSCIAAFTKTPTLLSCYYCSVTVGRVIIGQVMTTTGQVTIGQVTVTVGVYIAQVIISQVTATVGRVHFVIISQVTVTVGQSVE